MGSDNSEDKKEFDLNFIISQADFLFKKGNILDIKNHIDYAKSFIDQSMPNEKKIHLLYTIGTSYGDILTVDKTYKTLSELEKEEILEQSYYYFSLAEGFVDGTTSITIRQHLYTNFANLNSTFGRTINAISLFNKINGFPMAEGNLGISLFSYSTIIYDNSHKAILLHFAYNHLKTALMHRDYLRIHGADKGFEIYYNKIEHILSKNYLSQPLIFKKYDFGSTQKERNYRIWVAYNKLFLNPLNDVLLDGLVAHDIMHLPNMYYNLEDDNHIFDFTIINQLKQEFISCRYLFYEATNVNHKKCHFSDKDSLMYDLEYMVCSYSDFQIRMVYKSLFSIFDRIAFFINHYFKLGIKLRNISFRRVWNDTKIKNIVEKNHGLKGLYWLAKEVYEEKYRTINPKSQEYDKLRNCLEHRFAISTLDLALDQATEKNIEDNMLRISTTELYDMTLNLLKITREMIIYLICSITIEENRKRETSKTNIIADFSLHTMDEEIR